MNLFLSLILMLIFVPQAHAGLFGDILKGTADVLLNTTFSKEEGQLSSQGEQENVQTDQEKQWAQEKKQKEEEIRRKEDKAQQEQERKENRVSLKLEKGVYSIPLNADLETVLKWCEENQVIVKNLTKDQVKEKADRMLSEVKDAKVEYEINKFFTGGEGKLSDAFNNAVLDYLGKEALQNSTELLQALRDPVANYQGRSYLLDREFSKGIAIEEDLNGIQIGEACVDERITKSIYSLLIQPSEKSLNLLNQGLESVKIVFYKDESGLFSSYATIALYSADYERINREILAKQFWILIDVLSQKYGGYFIVENKARGFVRTYYSHLFLNDMRWDDFVGWGKNIFITGGMNQSLTTGELYEDSQYFKVFYLQDQMVEKVLAVHTKALVDCKGASKEEEADKARLIQRNF